MTILCEYEWWMMKNTNDEERLLGHYACFCIVQFDLDMIPEGNGDATV